MLYIKETEEGITIFLSIGDIIEYEFEEGIYGEGEVLEINESSNTIKILPLDDSLILVPRWISSDDVISF
ncbi:MAG: hypothetical protein V7K41_29935 [Nostoc sp.]|uniref:hypothetical protein n=1 Tax=Nostoc sp. TaxID=1180 RepID=UPI002FFBD644